MIGDVTKQQPTTEHGESNLRIHVGHERSCGRFFKRNDQQKVANRAGGADEKNLKPKVHVIDGRPSPKQQKRGQHCAGPDGIEMGGHALFSLSDLAGQQLKRGVGDDQQQWKNHHPAERV
jgi:hypothetical protein